MATGRPGRSLGVQSLATHSAAVQLHLFQEGFQGEKTLAAQTHTSRSLSKRGYCLRALVTDHPNQNQAPTEFAFCGVMVKSP
mmetsp:Transcript_8694/g.19061  ORF Transcript_8694/g.19061 Transcript_8694/m.19061 type:complete len:82 (+) Transcript_8694:130-375(+)